jgi:UrcA family protein
MIKLFTLPTALLATAALLAAAAPAQAKGESWQIGSDSIKVDYRDLNPALGADRAKLLVRVEKAAARICDANFSQRADVAACVTQAMGDMARQSSAIRLAVNERQPVMLAGR